MSGRAQLFVGRLPIDIRERDVEQVFEKYGRLLRCDVKYGMFGSSGRRGSDRMYGSSGRRDSGRNGMAYAFIEYDDRRDAEDAIKYENGREIRGQSIVVEWARGPSYRSNRESYGRSSRQNSDECYRCRRTGHWARNCPEQDNRDRYYPRSSRRRSRSRSRSHSYRRRRSVSRSRSKSRDEDRRRRSSSDYRQKSRSLSRDRKRKGRSASGSASPRKSPSRSRSRSHGKSHKKEKSKKSKAREPSKSRSRSPSPAKSRSRSRSPSYARKATPSPAHENDYADQPVDGNRSRSVSRSPPRRSVSKGRDQSDDNRSDRSVSRSKSR